MLLLRENVYKITAADKMRRGFIRVFLFHRKLRPVKQELSDRSERADFLCIPGTSGIAGI